MLRQNNWLVEAALAKSTELSVDDISHYLSRMLLFVPDKQREKAELIFWLCYYQLETDDGIYTTDFDDRDI